jgi:hypothetical protein
MNSTQPITYVYEVTGPDGTGHEIAITREHTGTAYARNGNVGNATEYFLWNATLDGEPAAWHEPRRSEAYEVARAKLLGIRYANGPRSCVNVRAWHRVREEMKASYRRQIVHGEEPNRGDGS